MDADESPQRIRNEVLFEEQRDSEEDGGEEEGRSAGDAPW